MEKSGQMRNVGMIWFLVNLVLGAYFINLGLNFVNLGFLDAIKNYITIIGGILIIIHGVLSLTKKAPYPPRYR
jgi:cytochrome c biogenesis protein CcdA